MNIDLVIHSTSEPSEEIINYLATKGNVKYVIRNTVENNYYEFIVDTNNNRFNIRETDVQTIIIKKTLSEIGALNWEDDVENKFATHINNLNLIKNSNIFYIYQLTDDINNNNISNNIKIIDLTQNI